MKSLLNPVLGDRSWKRYMKKRFCNPFSNQILVDEIMGARPMISRDLHSLFIGSNRSKKN